MSRITGSDAANLMEAYSAVYAPQELTEEQVWEEVENWVNSLVEEGYDLSEYTWEDMYEAYLDEIVRPTTGQMTAPRRDQVQTSTRPTPQTTRPAGGGMGGMRGTGRNRSTTQTSSSPGALRVPARPQQGPTDRPGLMPGLSVGPGGFNINNRPVQTTPARPAAPAPARPAAPATTQGSPRPTATPTTTTAPATTTSATTPAPRQRDTSISDMIGRSQIRQGAPINTGNRSSDIRSMALRGSVGATPTPTPTTKPNMQQQIRQRRLNMDLDLFDVVQGYLLDEGYAETEEAATVIMANMSEEWKTQIIESGYFPTKKSQREDEAKYKKGNSEVKHRTPQTQARPTPSK